MQAYFYELADELTRTLAGSEIFTAYLAGEDSDFCRLSQAKVRQAGAVKQNSLALRLIDGKRNVSGETFLSSVKAEDLARLKALLKTLREQLAFVPEDPYLLYATEVHSSERLGPSRLEGSADTIHQIVAKCRGLDLVGIYAAGSVHRGFANSLGQRNWYQTASFNFDFSLYLLADKAVKCGYAGFHWDDANFDQKLAAARAQLSVLGKPARSIKPGKYRVYLAPDALSEVTSMLAWGGFGLKAHRTKQSSLIKMVEDGARLNQGVTIAEDTAGGTSPGFSATGFVKPAQVRLIDAGAYKDCLVSPRSAKEYGVATNGASGSEMPESLSMAGGSLPAAEIAALLGDGIYINNLWYLNYSDRSSCRITGMTRFAAFSVEKGEITQPLNVMRFDESVLRLLGDNLLGLTAERELLLSPSTYGGRSTSSSYLPGALVEDFSFTL